MAWMLRSVLGNQANLKKWLEEQEAIKGRTESKRRSRPVLHQARPPLLHESSAEEGPPAGP
jgi:hypothetical protein